MALTTTGVKFQTEGFAQFDRTMKRANNHVLALNKNLSKLEASYKKTDKTLKALQTKQEKFDRTLRQSSRNVQTLTDRFDRNNDSFGDYGLKATSARLALSRLDMAQKEAADSSKDMSDSLRRANRQLTLLNDKVKRGPLSQFGSGATATGRGLDNLADGARRARQGLGGVNDMSLNTAANIANLALNVGETLVRSFDALIDVSKRATEATVGTAADFESAFVGVAKTTDGLLELTEEGFISLTEEGEIFRSRLGQLSTEIPQTFEDLAGIAELGGQLGFTEGIDTVLAKQDALVAFTETIAGLGEATDLTNEAAAKNLSRIANIFSSDFDDAGDNIRNLGNTIVRLGNESATSESEIVSFATRLAGAGKTVGLTQADVLGISAAFSSIGIRAQAGGTAVSTALLEMQKAANSTSEGFIDNSESIEENEKRIRDLVGQLRGLEQNTGLSADAILAQQDAFVEAGGTIAEFGEQLGDTQRRRLLGMAEDVRSLTAETQILQETHGQAFDTGTMDTFLRLTQTTKDEFITLRKENPAELFQRLVEGIAREGDNAGAVLQEIGLGSSQARQAFLGMAQNTDLLVSSIAKANEEFDGGNALLNEVEKRYATTESRLVMFRNQLRLTGATIGAEFLPSVNRMLQVGGRIGAVFGERIPDIFDALIAKLGEFEGLDLSNIIDFDFSNLDLEGSIDATIDLWIQKISEFDITPIQNALNTLTVDVIPAFIRAGNFLAENWDSITVAFNSFVAGGVALATIGAIGAVGAALAALTTPIGLVVAGVAAFSAAWQTNFLGIRDITISTVDQIKETVAGVTSAFQEGGISGIFEFFEFPPGTADQLRTVLAPILDFTLPESFANLQEKLSDLFEGESLVKIQQFGGFLLDAGAAIGSFAASVAIIAGGTVLDQISALVDGLAGIVGIVDGLLDGDMPQVEENLRGLGRAIADFTFAPFENALEFLDNLDIGGAFGSFTESALGEIDNFKSAIATVSFSDIFSNINNAELPFEAIFNKSLETLDIFVNTANGALESLDLGIPPIPDLAGLADKGIQILKDKFTGILNDIDLGLPDLGSLSELMPALGFFEDEEISPNITLDADSVSSTEAQQAALEQGRAIGQNASEGFAQGQLEAADLPVQAAKDVSEQTWSEWAASWITNSPSELTKGLGINVVSGFVLGLGETESIQPAIDRLNALTITGFQNMADVLSFTTQPALEIFRYTLDELSFLTIPAVTSSLTDGLIPAKQTLADVNNNDVVPSVDAVSDSENNLASIIESRVIPNLVNQTEKMSEAESRAKKLEKALKTLIKRYKALASAIKEASSAGAGVATGVTGNESLGGAGGTPAGSFARGGSFIVPNQISSVNRGPTGGQLIEVHAGELVNIVPKGIMDSPAIDSPKISGAGISTQIVNNDSSQRNSQYILNVKEAVSPTFRGSFGMLAALRR